MVRLSIELFELCSSTGAERAEVAFEGRKHFACEHLFAILDYEYQMNVSIVDRVPCAF